MAMSHQSQQLLRDSWLTSASAPSPPITSASSSSSLRNYTAKSRADGKQEKEKEIIHSGHFMVSHFEAEAQDDEDTELPMPEPDESSATIVELNRCTDVALLPSNQIISHSVVAPHSKTNNNAVIDISLAKLFKCMNLAYRWALQYSFLHCHIEVLITHIFEVQLIVNRFASADIILFLFLLRIETKNVSHHFFSIFRKVSLFFPSFIISKPHDIAYSCLITWNREKKLA